jgi:hypothetical protein
MTVEGVEEGRSVEWMKEEVVDGGWERGLYRQGKVSFALTSDDPGSCEEER